MNIKLQPAVIEFLDPFTQTCTILYYELFIFVAYWYEIKLSSNDIGFRLDIVNELIIPFLICYKSNQWSTKCRHTMLEMLLPCRNKKVAYTYL